MCANCIAPWGSVELWLSPASSHDSDLDMHNNEDMGGFYKAWANKWERSGVALQQFGELHRERDTHCSRAPTKTYEKWSGFRIKNNPYRHTLLDCEWVQPQTVHGVSLSPGGARSDAAKLWEDTTGNPQRAHSRKHSEKLCMCRERQKRNHQILN